MERILKSVSRWSPCLLEALPLEHVYPGLGKLPVLLQGANELWDFRVRWRGQHLQFSHPTEFRSIRVTKDRTNGFLGRFYHGFMNTPKGRLKHHFTSLLAVWSWIFFVSIPLTGSRSSRSAPTKFVSRSQTILEDNHDDLSF